jgi:glutathione S-transferase
MAPHITLEETGANYEALPILLSKGDHRTESYLKINPRGKVPALKIDGDVVTENTTILTYLAKSLPAGSSERRAGRLPAHVAIERNDWAR